MTPSKLIHRLLLPCLFASLPMAKPGFAATVDNVQALARVRGCLACHGMAHKQVGPGFAQVAARYRNDPAAPARLAARIQAGSVGAWGRVIMPRQPHVADAEAKALVGWILSQPLPPP